MSCMKANKYLKKGYTAILALITEQPKKERKIEDIAVVHDYPEVFPDDLPGLPPARQVEFQIDLMSHPQISTNGIIPFGNVELRPTSNSKSSSGCLMFRIDEMESF
ncbi:hypothetical protein E3N88_05772 [Mikania micrantha]|uniref:Reverse transcriptase domain-containing protein n=1 Tax=Mikania micrantha TaxID=192012 RepID=A0A5N6PMK7_9ASTR|nr:hypothetical protein E3N88_05772 [Mikania micrantha]